jgi:hypothetical protein
LRAQRSLSERCRHLASQAEEAVNALHAAFELDQD